MIDNKLLLFIEPSDNRTMHPVIDSLTRKITASLRKADSGILKDGEWTNGAGYFGWHTDMCGCTSACQDKRLPNGRITNSLAIHYVAFHRHEISLEQLQEIDILQDGEVVPTIDELWPQLSNNSARNKP